MPSMCFARDYTVRRLYERRKYNLSWLLIVDVCMAKFVLQEMT